MHRLIFIFLILIWRVCGQNIVSVVDESLVDASSWLTEGIERSPPPPNTLSNDIVKVSIENEDASEEQFCQKMTEGISLIMDITAGGWSFARRKAREFGVPYVHAQVSIYQWMTAADQFLQSRNATDAALIFFNDAQLDQGLYYLVEGSVIRVIVLSGIQTNTTKTLKKMRPAPAHYVIFSPSENMNEMFDKAVMNGLVTRDSLWLLMRTSPKTMSFKLNLIPGSSVVTIMTPNQKLCCISKRQPISSTCSCTSTEILDISKELVINSLIASIKAMQQSEVPITSGDCNSPPLTPTSTQLFYDNLNKELTSWAGVNWNEGKMQIIPSVEMSISNLNATTMNPVGSWTSAQGLNLDPSFKHSPIKRIFRVGSILARPWMYEKAKPSGSSDSLRVLEGYCMELTQKLAEQMKFEYEFVFPKDGKYGARLKDGSWNGLVGDLASGETDIIVAPLTMTSEREEVIDFVAPYFDQSGISIVIRKTEREESLFKFMTVLRPEVWISIVAALIVTGIMIWFLDKYSPYSAQNNSEYALQNCRKFTLKESFWFALTSFTPQGGGEAPKALSGRTLVAAYWLFVVLMLATFTANLAAFLTVERMQSPIQSLEALARQAKIAFTTTKDNSIYEYFYNMARAEDELFRVWKELTLNSTNDQSKYRVWDYPIKEQYTHILQVIDDTGTLATVEEGLQKVQDSIEGDFAFIHDASELRYEVYHKCFLTEVGEPFAEQPYAIAVQQGSHLQDEISRAILELQKDRYFEALTAKYWNSSARSSCPNNDDSEGINLQSLGGVFIATLIGLVLALIALAIEVMYYRKLPEKDSANKRMFKKTNKHISRINVSPVY